MAKKKNVQLPEVGSIVAFPLSNGLYSSCWILNTKVWAGSKHVLAVCSTYVSDTAPTAIEKGMTEVLYPDHHGIKKEPSVYWINSSPMKGSIVLGSVKPPAKLSGVHCDTYGGFENFHYDAISHWRWQHDRKALLAEEAEEERANEERIRRLLQKEEEERRSMTFDKLAKYKFFAEWDDYPPKKVITACRKIMKNLAEQLLNLGTTATKKQRLQAFKDSVDEFNALHAKYEDLEDTGVREDIVTEYTLFEVSAKIPDLAERIDEWRTW